MKMWTTTQLCSITILFALPALTLTSAASRSMLMAYETTSAKSGHHHHQGPSSATIDFIRNNLHHVYQRHPIVTTKDADVDAPSRVLESSKNSKCLTLETMSPYIRRMEYAVRGQVVITADKLAQELLVKKNDDDDDDGQKYPFDHIVYTNIGNPQAVGQKPLTWPRQVLALIDLPDELGVDNNNLEAAKLLFPGDAIRRAKEIKAKLGSSGAYSHSQGAYCFREDVARFIKERDGGVPSDPENIFLTNGASQGIVSILNTILANENCGVMIPIPQYPIYSATIDLFNGHKVGYHLDEENNWALDIQELKRSYQHAQEEGIDVRALVLINPGNPTGAVLTRENLHEIVRFCSENKLVLLADEVYQENVYDENAEFISCKRACYETGLLDADAAELVSFHSTSKGVFGECGRRGGYMELVGIDPDVKDQLYKLASAGLCSSVSGQIMTSLMVRGPSPGDESFESHQGEMREIFESLKRRSKLLSQGLNSIPGFSCQPAQGSMYCFPSVEMPEGAIKAAKAQGVAVDTLYCISLLEHTGICVVPASGFGQKAGRHGFRTTFLPSEKEMTRVVELIREHHTNFCAIYSEYA